MGVIPNGQTLNDEFLPPKLGAGAIAWGHGRTKLGAGAIAWGHSRTKLGSAVERRGHGCTKLGARGAPGAQLAQSQSSLYLEILNLTPMGFRPPDHIRRSRVARLF